MNEKSIELLELNNEKLDSLINLLEAVSEKLKVLDELKLWLGN